MIRMAICCAAALLTDTTAGIIWYFMIVICVGIQYFYSEGAAS